jgi:hypothetical protein
MLLTSHGAAQMAHWSRCCLRRTRRADVCGAALADVFPGATAYTARYGRPPGSPRGRAQYKGRREGDRLIVMLLRKKIIKSHASQNTIMRAETASNYSTTRRPLDRQSSRQRRPGHEPSSAVAGHCSPDASAIFKTPSWPIKALGRFSPKPTSQSLEEVVALACQHRAGDIGDAASACRSAVVLKIAKASGEQ